MFSMFKNFLVIGLLLVASVNNPYYTCGSSNSSNNSTSGISGADITPSTTLPPENTIVLESNLKPNSEQSGTNNLWSVQNNGVNLRALSYQDKSTSFAPQISPDKAKILFWSNRPLNSSSETSPNNLWVMGIDGSNPQALTQSTLIESMNTWETAQYSPDGSKIIFLSSRNLNLSNHDAENPSLNIWIMNSDGSDLHPLTRFDTRTVLSQLKWSPDGNNIAFLSNLNPEIENTRQANLLNIWTLQKDGSHLQPVTHLQHATVSDYDWSPDNSKFVFTSNMPSEGTDIVPLRSNLKLWTIANNSSQLTLLTAVANSSNTHPLWSPNGKQIVYISNRKTDSTDFGISNNNLWIYNFEGNTNTPVTKLVNDSIQHSPVKWSKDSKKILFISNRHTDKSDKINSNGISNLWMISTDGNDLGNVTGLNKSGQIIGLSDW